MECKNLCDLARFQSQLTYLNPPPMQFVRIEFAVIVASWPNRARPGATAKPRRHDTRPTRPGPGGAGFSSSLCDPPGPDSLAARSGPAAVPTAACGPAWPGGGLSLSARPGHPGCRLSAATVQAAVASRSAETGTTTTVLAAVRSAETVLLCKPHALTRGRRAQLIRGSFKRAKTIRGPCACFIVAARSGLYVPAASVAVDMKKAFFILAVGRIVLHMADSLPQ